jgi:flagellar L-ring protein FlgH
MRMLNSTSSCLLMLLATVASNHLQAQESSLLHNPIVQQRLLAQQTSQMQAPIASRTLPAAPAPSALPPATGAVQDDASWTQNPQPPIALGQPAENPSSSTPMNPGPGNPLRNDSNTPRVMPTLPLPLQQPYAVQQGLVAPATYVGGPLSVQNPASYLYQAPPPKRTLKKHDIIQIRVDELARMSADGVSSQRKSGLYDLRLQDWITLDGFRSVNSNAFPDGQPRMRGDTNQTYRANSQLMTREQLTFNIAAEIVDIYPNGNIVLEAHKQIENNDNRWKMSVSGICQDSAIGPDNTVLSKDVLNLKIDKQELGQARDGYKRGWLAEFIGRFGPL